MIYLVFVFSPLRELALLGKSDALAIRLAQLMKSRQVPWDAQTYIDASPAKEGADGIVQTFVGDVAVLVWDCRTPRECYTAWEATCELWKRSGREPCTRQHDLGAGATVTAPGAYDKFDRLFAPQDMGWFDDRAAEFVSRVLNVPPEAISIRKKTSVEE